MANIIKLSAGLGWTSAGFTASDFNSRANGSFVLATSTIDNSTNLDLEAEFSGQWEVGGTTTAASYLQLWLMPLNRDGSTWGDGTPTGTNLPGAQYCVASGGVRVGITSGNAVFFTFRSIRLPRGTFRWGLSNHMGAALDASASFAGEFQTTNLNTNG